MTRTLKVIPLNATLLDPLANYWDGLNDEELLAMGALRENIPSREQFIKKIKHQLTLPDAEARAFALIAIKERLPVGHCNLNPVIYGQEGKMHLHLWNTATRAKGMGTTMVKQSIPIFFEKFKLSKIVCEPLAKNYAPNRALEKAGFTFIKKYSTLPSPHCFIQEVNRWEIKPSN